jgi:hypothetical protein
MNAHGAANGGTEDMMPTALALQCTTERFDYRSELPEDANAGNRFYGRDLAEWLAGALDAAGHPATFFDEDWGWLVTAAAGAAAPFQIAIYNLAEHGEGGRPGIGEWGIRLQAFERRKMLGLLARNVAVDVPAALERAVRGAFTSAGIALEPWADGPS